MHRLLHESQRGIRRAMCDFRNQRLAVSLRLKVYLPLCHIWDETGGGEFTTETRRLLNKSGGNATPYHTGAPFLV